jgi:hypothetical protein
MRAPLLIYFKENEVEFWSIDQNRRLIPVNCGSNNKAPLYFLVNGDQIAMDQNAKLQFEAESDNCFGNYWANLLNPKLKYNRFNTTHQFSSLLAYSLKEEILPAIIRFNYSDFTQESFLNTYQIVIVYDSFIDEQHRNVINKELIEIIGFHPSSLVSFDYWELYRSYYEKNGKLNSKESFISINSALGDLNINLVAQNPTLTINKKTLHGRGNDPRIDTILDYVAELAIKRGSLISMDEIKKRLINEGQVILDLLKEGWVNYKIKNRNIGIYPLNLDFHRSAIDNRLNNRASLNYIQSELDSFRNNNQANGLKILLNGEIINQDVFTNFFKTTYSNVEVESTDFSKNFKTFIFNYFDIQFNTNISTTTPIAGGSDSNLTPTETCFSDQKKTVNSSEVSINTNEPKVIIKPQAPTIPGVPPVPILPGSNRASVLKSSPAAPLVPKPIQVQRTVSAPKMPTIPSKSILTNSKENTKSQEISIKPNATIKNEVKPLSVPLPPVSKVKLPPPPPPPVPKKNK